VDNDAQFYTKVFQGLDKLIEPLLDEYETFYGDEFKRADVKWHEDSELNGLENVYKMTWGDLCLMEMRMAPSKRLAGCAIAQKYRRN
jgi:hypothetical protein